MRPSDPRDVPIKGRWCATFGACVLVLTMISCGGDDAERDAGGADAGPRDAGPRDAGASDAGPGDAGPAPIPEPPYTQISETGAYADPAAGTIAEDAIPFAPNNTLWTDGATKRRWLILPPGAQIDTRDPDHWFVPVGTRVFKEFARPEGRVETRLIQRVTDRGSDSDWWFGAFVWNPERTEATLAPNGATDVLGTTHDVPGVPLCWVCHGGEPGHLLGVATVQLTGASPFSVADAQAAGLFTSPVSPAPVPGDATERAALGYLHANCGHCHNDNGTARPDTTLNLRLTALDITVTETAIYRSTVGVALDRFRDPAVSVRVVPGDPAASGVVFRMSMRGDRTQMPPVGTEVVHDVGVTAVSDWILSLAP